jgi:hypothetical protein
MVSRSCGIILVRRNLATVSGSPYKLRCDYLALFVAGLMIGKAKEIDTTFTREHAVVRMYVQVTSIAHILDRYWCCL